MPAFLDRLARVGTPTLINTHSGQPVAARVELAITRAQRRRGLLGRDGLAPGSAFVLAPCRAVHTIGMRFPIDVIFVDDEGQVVKLVEQMEGWRIAMAGAATMTIELPSGTLQAIHVQVGDRLCFAPASADAMAHTA
jgi:uncharacterized protein